MNCSEVMTQDPVFCLGSDTVMRAAQVMRAEDIGPLPVVQDEASKKLIGIVTDRDLTLNVLAEGRDPRETRVEEVMSRRLVTCRPDEDVEHALDLMEEHQVRRIPVVDESGAIVGIIAQADVATRVARPNETAELVEQVSEPRQTSRRPTARKSSKKSAKSRTTTTRRTATKNKR